MAVTPCPACGGPADGWACAEHLAQARRAAFLDLDPGGGTADGYDDGLFALLERLEPRSFWFRARNRLIVWALRRYFPRARSLLEVGCGTGFVLDAVHRALPRLDVVGAEILPAGLEVARRRLPGLPLVRMDARRIPFERAFDVVGAFDVLEHVDDDEAALAAMARATAPGGGLLLTVPQHPRLWSAADEYASHRRRYTRPALVRKVECAGYEVLRVTSFVTTLLPLLAAARATAAKDAAAYDLERELTHPRPVDRLLEAVLAGELLLIRAGASLPAGGSLVLAARLR